MAHSHSQHNLLEAHLCCDQGAEGHMAASVSLRLLGTLTGGALLITSLLAESLFIFDTHGPLLDLMSMMGAVLLGVPVIWHALKSLLTNHRHMDELVALAYSGVSFANGEYRVAGTVAFFMLIAELIETRTALGARATIESLVRITPTVARRLKGDGGVEEEVQVQCPAGRRPTSVCGPGDNIPGRRQGDRRAVHGQSGHDHR